MSERTNRHQLYLCQCNDGFSLSDPLYGTHKPRIVTLCGSTRFTAHNGRNYWQEAARAHLLAGVAVFSIGVDFKSDTGLLADPNSGFTQVAKREADLLHLWKIRMSDGIFVLNVAQYVGESTRREVAYARRLGKIVQWLEQPVGFGYHFDEWDVELDAWTLGRAVREEGEGR